MLVVYLTPITNNQNKIIICIANISIGDSYIKSTGWNVLIKCTALIKTIEHATTINIDITKTFSIFNKYLDNNSIFGFKKLITKQKYIIITSNSNPYTKYMNS